MSRNSVIIIPTKNIPVTAVGARLDHLTAKLVGIEGKVSKLAQLAELLVETEELTMRTHTSRLHATAPKIAQKPALMLVPRTEKRAACA